MNELVKIDENNQVTTDSLTVAEKFVKEHKDVLESIRKLTAELPKEFNGRNFPLVKIKDAKGELRPVYNLTRDGFTLLAMGFTGKRALQFKLKYIEAFNKMEAALLGGGTSCPVGSTLVKSHCRSTDKKPKALPSPQFDMIPDDILRVKKTREELKDIFEMLFFFMAGKASTGTTEAKKFAEFLRQIRHTFILTPPPKDSRRKIYLMGVLDDACDPEIAKIISHATPTKKAA